MIAFPDGALVALRSRAKVVTVVTAATAAVVGSLVWFYLRRRKKKSSVAKGKKDANANSVGVKRGPSPAVGLPSKPSASSLAAHQRRRGSTSRSTSGSVAGPLGLVQENAMTQRHFSMMHAGVDNLTDSISNFERSVRVLRDSKLASRQERELLEGLEMALEAARQLQSDVNKLLERCCPESLEEASVASTLTPMGSQYALYEGGVSNAHMRRTLSVLSDESFASALDDLALSFPEVEEPVRDTQVLPYESLQLYQVGMEKAQRGEVQCRVMRTEFLHCLSDDDYLAKLYCIREALAVMMRDEVKRLWIADAGRDLLSALLLRAGKDTSGFYKAYDAMLGFVNATEDWSHIEDELSYRKVMQITFYDVVLDFILMDAFDDLAHPPASVLAVAQNRFLSASFKESTLSAVVWSVVKAKRTRLVYSRGFIAHFYDISEQVSPTMAWGFLGTDENLREDCYYFKDQVCNFLSDIFCVDRVRYTNVDELADDIYQICQSRMTTTKQRFMPKRDTPSPNHLGNGLDTGF